MTLTAPSPILRRVTYPGGKNGPGVYQTIINQIPPHQIYIEPFAGSASIYRHKRLAVMTYLIERDEYQAVALAQLIDVDPRRFDLQPRPAAGLPTGARYLSGASADSDRLQVNPPAPAVNVICADSRQWLKAFRFRGGEFVYADPPYLGASRRAGAGRQLYRHEISSAEEHEEILDILSALPCPVMISGYWSEFYGRRLEAWRVIRFQASTRGGKRACECLWMNYPAPVALHDYTHLGQNSRERQDVRRMKERWKRKLEKMPAVKRQAILAALSDLGL